MKISAPLVEVQWIDAYGESKWTELDDWGEGMYIIHSVGYLLAEDKNYLRLAANIQEQTLLKDNTMNIPKKVVLSIKYLRGRPKK